MSEDMVPRSRNVNVWALGDYLQMPERARHLRIVSSLLLFNFD